MEKHFKDTRSENVNARDMRGFSIRLPAHVSDYVERAACNRGLTVEQLVAELITESVRKDIEPLDVQLRRVNELINEIIILAKKAPMQEEKDAKTGKPTFEQREKKRDHLIELGMQAYDELSKISRSEKAAKQAEFRMQAFTVMARVGMFNAAVIRDQEAEDIARLIEELEEGNDRIEARIKELQEKRREEEEKERWRANI